MPVVAQDVVHVEPVCSPIDYCDRGDYLAGDRDDYLAEREPTFNPFAENAAIKKNPGAALGSDRGPVGPARAKFDFAPLSTLLRQRLHSTLPAAGVCQMRKDIL